MNPATKDDARNIALGGLTVIVFFVLIALGMGWIA